MEKYVGGKIEQGSVVQITVASFEKILDDAQVATVVTCVGTIPLESSWRRLKRVE